MEKKKVDTSFWQDSQFVVVQHIDAHECPVCGERVYDQETTAKILHAVTHGKVQKYFQTPVYSLEETMPLM
jgi:YgiT-type zinc finger domain-containing protein